MNKFILLLTILMCCFFNLIVVAQKHELHNYFTAHQKLNQFNGSILLAKNNEVIFQNSYNETNLNDSLKVTPQSKFIIASVSKVFVKIAILKLVDQNKLKLTDNISKYIPTFPNGDKITIEQLLFHKSGLPRELSNYENYEHLSLNQIIILSQKETLLFEPNTQTAYSNVGYFLLHYIIQETSGRKYLDFIQENVFKKLKLKNTFEYNNATNKKHFVYGFTNENDSIETTEIKTINQFETGNIITTINDLYYFSQRITNSNYLSKQSKTILFQTDSMLVQAGGRKGYRAYLQINLKNKTTFILLSNQNNIAFDEIIKETNNIIENKPFQLPQKSERKEIILPNEVLKKHEGIYISNEHKLNFTIKIIDNHLVAIDPNNSKTILYAEADNSFFDNPNSKDTYLFITNNNDNVIAFQILTNGIKINLEKQN